ncbi:porphobilinogen synthase [Saccharicrinis aurantiacus]|uniref:porphobilinogen synthase n=1 Tax=Saccharicrinis aurantiacus TaxID=1849719 RepID=UPI002491ED03|nr:porphobilinogen synthase [Saccharicrinis aurantiacus]
MFKRFRSTRLSPEIRDNHADVDLQTRDLIYPYFLVSGEARKEAVPSIEGAFKFSLDLLLQDLEGTIASGIDKILLKGIVDDREKSKDARAAFKHNNLIELAVKKIKETYPSLIVITDVDLTPYTSHGQGGILRGLTVDNDKTIEILAKMAESHARAGADFVAPSAMMDGQVHAIKTHLKKRGYPDVKLMSFAAKYASNYYGPDRGIDGLNPAGREQKAYQVDYRTRLQGLDEVATDLDEGADWVGITPAQTYLDVIVRSRIKFSSAQIVGYQSSGEYMSIVNAANQNLLEQQPAMIESLTAIKRAGANYIVTYFAPEMAQYLNGDPYYVI